MYFWRCASFSVPPFELSKHETSLQQNWLPRQNLVHPILARNQSGFLEEVSFLYLPQFIIVYLFTFTNSNSTHPSEFSHSSLSPHNISILIYKHNLARFSSLSSLLQSKDLGLPTSCSKTTAHTRENENRNRNEYEDSYSNPRGI